MLTATVHGVSSRTALVLACAAGLAVAAPVVAQTRLLTNQQGAMGANQRSYVRDANGKMVATDRQFVQDIRDNWPGDNKTVDAVFQQCFGGGFVARFEADAGEGPAAKRIANFTVSSASRHDESSQFNHKLGIVVELPTMRPPSYLVSIAGSEDFTRAWVEDAWRNGPGAQTEGRPAVQIGGNFRFSLTGANGRNESMPLGTTAVRRPNVSGAPQYYSPDPQRLGATGPNNGRVWIHTADEPVYAVLVAWSTFSDNLIETVPWGQHMKSDAGIAAHLTRVYRLLNERYGVPAGNIVVLYKNQPRGSRTPAFPNMQPPDGSERSPAADRRNSAGTLLREIGLYVDGPNDRDTWHKALRGELFSGPRPTRGRLFIYSTGHGGMGDLDAITRRFGGAGVLAYETRPGVVDKSSPEWVPGENSGEFAVRVGGGSGTVSLQITTSRPLAIGAGVRIDGTQGVYSLMPVPTGEVRDLGQFIPKRADLVPQIHYRATFPATAFDQTNPAVDVEILGAGDTDPQNTLVRAMVFTTGAAEYLSTVARALCAVDFNADGRVDPDDLSDFIAGAFATPADPRCDLDLDGLVTPDDLSDYIAAYFAGC